MDENKLDSFNVPYYSPPLEEVQDIVEREGSFTIELMKAFSLDAMDKQEKDARAKVGKYAKGIRSFTESMISNQFGDEIIDKLYDKVTHIVVEDLAKESPKTTSIILVLSKIVG
ncbi:putative caffeine synthase 2 [Camellia lanceoleosa]|uniref:Caffeine synthase 2 n=1 Tax=Camellia lanceoleosa TaxID=1840588 RepID=A0ACC0IZA5_9ERIC|nr:putative caffeine synthase 2 [Camellia lanceoleosa]